MGEHVWTFPSTASGGALQVVARGGPVPGEEFVEADVLVADLRVVRPNKTLASANKQNLTSAIDNYVGPLFAGRGPPLPPTF
jgi:hypothetical protein